MMNQRNRNEIPWVNFSAPFFAGLMIIALSTSITSDLQAQDTEVSQLYALPLHLNPALSGNYDGKYRVSIMYRDQWASMITDPYRSYALSGDMKIQIGRKHQTYKDYASAGVFFLGDKVNPFDYSTNQITINGAFHKFLDMGTYTYLSAGMLAGVVQKNFIYEDFTFQDQFNGIDGYPFNTAEDLPQNNHAFFDLALGVSFTTRFNRDLAMVAGGSIYHFHKPNVSFYKETDPDHYPNILKELALKPRINGHVVFDWQLYHNFSLTPGFAFISQDAHTQMRMGTGTRFELSDVRESAFHIGGWFKLNSEVDGISLNTFSLMTGFEYKKLLIGFSYDLSIDDLVTYQLGQHVFEFTLSFIGDYEDDNLFCPRF